MIIEWITAILILAGSFFMLVAAIGILRLQDIYLRMHAATKAPSLGAFLLIAGVMLYFRTTWLFIEGFLIILFIFMTAPVGAHVLAQVAHLMKSEKYKKTQIDELEDRHEKRLQALEYLTKKTRQQE
jgi:multicomponent Na+:H+ antiporter subunit G